MKQLNNNANLFLHKYISIILSICAKGCHYREYIRTECQNGRASSNLGVFAHSLENSSSMPISLAAKS
jgi:hypothetical protein